MPEGPIESVSKTQALRLHNSQKTQKKMKKLKDIIKKSEIQRNKIPINTTSSYDADREKTQEEAADQILIYQ